MTQRRIPEPTPPPTAEERAADRELAVTARAAGDALQVTVDMLRPRSFRPDGYSLDDLQRVADTLKGWALKLAIGSDIDLVNQWTGRRFVELTGSSLDQPHGGSADAGPGRAGETDA